ncbi:MAG: hypothetical protein IT210_08280, partial [Armatimonadetes bacterium]|nr:hypothetical protein [Armatimonadota bacterium]
MNRMLPVFALMLIACSLRAAPPETRWALLLTTQEHKIDARMTKHLESAGLRLESIPKGK